MLRQIFLTHAYPVYEIELRARFLQAALLAAASVAVLYLLQGALGFVRPRLFPWDGLLGILLCLICELLLRQGSSGRVSLAASWLVAAVNILATLYSQFYGIQHPVTAVYLIGIILAGMLVGGWFLRLWSLFGGLFVLVNGFLELNGLNDRVLAPIRTIDVLWQTVIFWWMLFGVTAWLVWLFARNLEGAVQVSRAQTTALTRTLNGLAHEGDLDTFLRQVLTTISERLGTQYATLFFHAAGADEIAVRLAYDNGNVLRPAEMKSRIPGPAPAADLAVWQTLLRTREPQVVVDVEKDPHISNRALLLAQGIRTVLYVPLLLGSTVVGFFSINSLEKRPFPPVEIELAQALAMQVTLAMQLTQLAEREGETAVVAERNRMAREIHDTLAQGFTGILIQLEAAEDALEDDSQEAALHLNQARELARTSLAEARRSVWALRPQALDTQDLAQALRDMTRRLTAGTAVQATVTVTGDPSPLPVSAAAELLRIGQEAVTNALKHSAATEVAVQLEYAPGQLTLAVADNGKGFDPGAAHGGFGLTSMHERAKQLNGRLTVTSEPGAGTRIVCRV